MVVGALTAAVGACIAGTFAGQLVRQYAARRRHHALAWALALGLYAAGMVALVVGFAWAWTPVSFGAYWLTGALLTAPILAVGQLQLLDPRRAVLWWTLAGLFGAWALVAVVSAPYDHAALAAADAAGGVPVGRDVLGDTLAYGILRPFTFVGAVVVLAGSVWSGVTTRRPGVLLIAAGVAVAATSSGFVRAGYDMLVPVVLSAGVALMYLGFRSAGRSRRPPGPSRRARRVTGTGARP